MLMTILAFLAGFALSATAAYYSIIGLLAIFPGAVVPIVLMGITLEFGKLVAASWIYRNWRTSPFLIRAYMGLAVLVLMFITSMGIFGFLSKAHLDQSLLGAVDNQYEIETLNSTIESKNKTVALLVRQMDNIDESLSKYIEMGYVTKGLDQKKQLDVERKELDDQRLALENELVELKSKRNTLSIDVKKNEAEIGPLKYIAELVYGEAEAPKMFDKTVRWVIVLIVSVFDPLAIALLIAGNISLMNRVMPVVGEGRRRPIINPEKLDYEPEIVYTANSEPVSISDMDETETEHKCESCDGGCERNHNVYQT